MQRSPSKIVCVPPKHILFAKDSTGLPHSSFHPPASHTFINTFLSRCAWLFSLPRTREEDKFLVSSLLLKSMMHVPSEPRLLLLRFAVCAFNICGQGKDEINVSNG
jgi:hypothetical protein